MTKFNLFTYFAILLFCSSCLSDEKPVVEKNSMKLEAPDPIDQVSIMDLNTDEEKGKFLSDLFEHDQYLRKSTPKRDNALGYNSETHKAHYAEMKASDEMCLKKAKKYLDTYGFPNLEKHGKDAYMGLLFVFHHSPKDNVDRHKYLPMFYEAYKAGNLEEARFDFYLGRMYDYEFGKRLKIESPFKPADRIAKYMDAFNFKPK